MFVTMYDAAEVLRSFGALDSLSCYRSINIESLRDYKVASCYS